MPIKLSIVFAILAMFSVQGQAALAAYTTVMTTGTVNGLGISGSATGSGSGIWDLDTNEITTFTDTNWLSPTIPGVGGWDTDTHETLVVFAGGPVPGSAGQAGVEAFDTCLDNGAFALCDYFPTNGDQVAATTVTINVLSLALIDFTVETVYNTISASASGFSSASSGIPLTATRNYVMTASTVPVPAAAWLFGSALLGLTGLKRYA